MFGPAGFMRAPNTHEGRPAQKNYPRDALTLTSVWENNRSKSLVEIEVEPSATNDTIQFRNLDTRRKGTVSAAQFIKRYTPYAPAERTP